MFLWRKLIWRIDLANNSGEFKQRRLPLADWIVTALPSWQSDWETIVGHILQKQSAILETHFVRNIRNIRNTTIRATLSRSFSNGLVEDSPFRRKCDHNNRHPAKLIPYRSEY